MLNCSSGPATWCASAANLVPFYPSPLSGAASSLVTRAGRVVVMKPDLVTHALHRAVDVEHARAGAEEKKQHQQPRLGAEPGVEQIPDAETDRQGRRQVHADAESDAHRGPGPGPGACRRRLRLPLRSRPVETGVEVVAGRPAVGHAFTRGPSTGRTEVRPAEMAPHHRSRVMALSRRAGGAKNPIKPGVSERFEAPEPARSPALRKPPRAARNPVLSDQPRATPRGPPETPSRRQPMTSPATPPPTPPSDSPDALLARFVALQSAGDLAGALPLIERLVALTPGDARVHGYHAYTLERLGRSADALAGYARALACDPTYTDAGYNRACLLARLGDPGAEPAFAELIAAVPDHAGARAALAVLRGQRLQPRFEAARALAQAGDRAGAEAAYRALRVELPDNVPLLHNLAGLIAERDPAGAIELWRSALAIEPDNVEVRAALGQGLLAQGRVVEAQPQLAAVVARRPDHTAIAELT